MSEKDDGGPALPIPGSPFADLGGGNYTLAVEGSDGMSLRDYFAAQALCGLSRVFLSSADAPEAARRAYALADAMLEARKR